MTTCLRLTDEGNESVWRDRWTGEERDFTSIPWRLASEPTGDVYENCAGLINEDNKRYWAFDIDCSQKIPTVCEDIKELFSLRGLCPHSLIDSLYRLVTDQENRRTFIGPTGWRRLPGGCASPLMAAVSLIQTRGGQREERATR